MNIWFASNNAHKKLELQGILNSNGICAALKIPSEESALIEGSFNPEETGSTFCDNVLIKARELRKLLKNKEDLIIADDSGLCVDALGGRPGVFSAIYGEANGQVPPSSRQNLMLLEEIGDNPLRSARFVCAMALLLEDERFIIVQETLEGQIVKKSQMRGEGGFGYDPIFLIPCFDRTLAELSAKEKNEVSHRGKAGKLIANIIKNRSTNYTNKHELR